MGRQARHCRANILVVADQEQLAKMLEVREELPELAAIVQYSGEVMVGKVGILQVTEPGVLSWAHLLHLGRQQGEEELQDRLRWNPPEDSLLVQEPSSEPGVHGGLHLRHHRKPQGCHDLPGQPDMDL